ncbi:MAG: ABC transporter permease, partial [Hyphomonadaceae bacterium]
MRNIYLIARRDYLGYVTAWGFWLGLMLTPVLMSIGMLAPALAASSTPERYYTVVEEGDEFLNAMRVKYQETQAEMARTQIVALTLVRDDSEDVLARFDAAIEDGLDADAAFALTGLSDTMEIPQASYVSVPPPARTAEALAPWLLGERMVDGPLGPKPLFAAILVPADGGEIEYWSENVTAFDLLSKSRRVSRDMAREATFRAAGVSPDLIGEADAAARDVVERRARPEASGGGGEVTLADKAPFWASIGIAFMLWMLIFSVVNYLLMGTIEERSNKIFDTLLTSVKLPHLLAGKLLAVLAVSLTLMSVWTFGGMAVTLVAGSMVEPEIMGAIGTIAGAALAPGIILPAILSFILGYLIYGSIFLALGSLCDTI